MYISTLNTGVLPVIVHINFVMLPFGIDFRPDLTIYEQVVYAARKSIISGQLHVGDEFRVPSRAAITASLGLR